MRIKGRILIRVSEIRKKVKRTFDQSSRQRAFQKGDTILLWDKQKEKPGKHGIFVT
jgi:hypothetical protein